MRPNRTNNDVSQGKEDVIPLYSPRGITVGVARAVWMLSIPEILIPKGAEKLTGVESSTVFWTALITGVVAFAIDRILCKFR